MASVKGNPEVDKNYSSTVKNLVNGTTHKVLINLDQKVLRDAAYELKVLVAKLEKYNNVRDSQARGGMK